MSNPITYWKHAELALAAYGNLLLGDPNTTELRRVGMSATQAFHFATSWRVVSQHDVPSSGLSAKVFEDLADGKRYLSIRGTEPTDVGDIGTDFLIVFTGYEINLSAQYRQLKAKVGEWLADGTLQQGFTVTGHSLGGFLATGIAADFSGSISHAYLFNSPGLNGVLGGATAPILRAFGITAPVDSSKISNIKADAGLSLIAGLGAQVAPPIWIAIEDQFLSDITSPPPARNHTQEVLTDALAVYAAYNALMPALTTESMAAITRAASVHNKSTLESTLNALRTLILGEVQGTDEGNRDDFYRNLYALQQSDQYKSLADSGVFNKISGINADTLALEARQNFESFLSLRYLLPFTFDAATDLLPQAHPDLYATWLDDQEKWGDKQTNLEYSDQWIADRAALLVWKDQYFSADGKIVLRGSSVETYLFESKSVQEPDINLTVVGRQRASVINPAKVVFGCAESETITGSDVNTGDRLYGEDGDDTLIGGGGNDHLEGGKGFDTYVIDAGDGFDSIMDSDGAGRIVFDGNEAGTGYKISDNLYISGDKKFEYCFDGAGEGAGTLIVNGSVRIDGFQNGDLGIDLIDGGGLSEIQPTQFSVLSNNMIEWGTELADFYLWGMPNYNPGGPQHDLVFLGLGGDDLVTSTFDVPYNDDSSPSFYGGEGDDVLITSSYRGHIVGGAGQDIVLGGAGDDYLYGDSEFEMINFFYEFPVGFGLDYRFGADGIGIEPYFYYSQNIGEYWNLETSDFDGYTVFFQDGIKEVLCWLGMISPQDKLDAHNDYVSGGEGDDVIYGGAGRDILHGGAGNDRLYGGNGVSGFSGVYNASIIQISRTPFFEKMQTILALFYEAEDDFLDGGAGNDRVIDSDGGSDYLLGGDGDDFLVDESVDVVIPDAINYLDGGAGNDVLIATNRSSEGLDILVGEEGNDYLEVANDGRSDLQGGPGNDTYRIMGYRLPLETIIDNFDKEGFDTLVLPTSYWPLQSNPELPLMRDEANLYFGHPGQSHSVTVLNWFVGAEYRIDRIIFDDWSNPQSSGTLILDPEAIDAIFTSTSAGDDFFWGSPGNDDVAGLAGDDILHGDAGDDMLDGGDGLDTLFGDTGNDRLAGGAGDDVYMFDRDFGQDVIEDTGGNDLVSLTGFSPDDIKVILDGERLVLQRTGFPDHISVRWQPDQGYAIEQVRFSDETVWDMAALESIALIGSVNSQSENVEPERPAYENPQLEIVVPVLANQSRAATVQHKVVSNIPLLSDPGVNYFIPSTADYRNNDGMELHVADGQQDEQASESVGSAQAAYPETLAQLPGFRSGQHRLDPEQELNSPEEMDAEWSFIAQAGNHAKQEQMAAAWRRTHESLDAHLAREDAAPPSSDRFGFSMSSLDAGSAENGFQRGLIKPGISGHELPVFSNRFEGLREGWAQIA